MTPNKLALCLVFMALGCGDQGKKEKDLDWRNDSRAFQSARVEKKSERAFELNTDPSVAFDTNFFIQNLAKISGRDPLENGTKLRNRSDRKFKELARLLLAKEYEQLGFKIKYQDYGTGRNFIAEREDFPGAQFLILSSHLDSVGNAGANDDATGMISALTISRGLVSSGVKVNLRILAFDEEELGLVGSEAYVNSLSEVERSQIKGAINLEMMGYNSRKDFHFHVIDCDRSESTFITQAIRNWIHTPSPLVIVKACTDRSDHASFWNANIPAVVVSENFFGGDGDRCYHRKCDVFDDRLSIAYIEAISVVMTRAVQTLMEEIKKKS